MLVQDTAKNVGGVFYETQCRLSVSLFRRKQTLAAVTDLIHLVHMRWVSVELYKNWDFLVRSSPRHDTLGGEGRDAGYGHLLSANIAVENLAAADRRRPMDDGIRCGWSPVVVVVTCCR